MTTAALLVRDARVAAGLSLRGLAARTGVSASTVSRIERGSMDPTLTMLRRVLGGASKTLVIAADEIGDGPSIASVASAVLRGTDPLRIDWTLLRGFADWAQRHRDDLAGAIEDPPARTATPLDAILAAFTEELCRTYRLTPPRWTSDVAALAHRWEPEGTPRMLTKARAETPQAFRARRLTLSRSTLFHDDKAIRNSSARDAEMPA